MEKLIDIKNKEQEKAFELHRDSNVLYLNIKCSDSRRHHKIVTINVSDVIYQIIKAIGSDEWRAICNQAYIR